MIVLPENRKYPADMRSTDRAIAESEVYTGFVCYGGLQAFLGQVPSEPEAAAHGVYMAVDNPTEPDPSTACPIYQKGFCGDSGKACEPNISTIYYGPGLKRR